MSDGLRAPWGGWLLAAVYVVVGAASFGDDVFLNDEGLLTRLFSELIARDFVPTFFLQKARPPLALLYAPVASIGVGAFVWAHLCVSALAVPLVAATARRLGHERPNIAAAVVALSPMFVAAGAAGLSNADAVVGVAVVAWLWASDRDLAMGIVLGMLVWVRAELLVFVAVMLVWAAWSRRFRPVIGLSVWPVVYGLAGAAYHVYLPWMLHYPPALSESMPGNLFWQPQHRAASLVDLVATAIAITPAFAAVVLARWSRLHALERVWLAFVVAFAGALVVLPRWQIFNFDQSPRYLLPVLPIIALVVGRACADLGRTDAPRALVLTGVAALGIAVHRGGGELALCWTTVGVAVAAAIAGGGRPRAAIVTVLLVLVMGPRHFGQGARIARRTQAAALDEIVERLGDVDPAGRRPVVTNEPLLASYLARSGGQPDRPVHYIAQADQLYELRMLTNPANGQRQRVFAALAQGMYGIPILDESLSTQSLPDGALLALIDDPRLAMVMPPEQWRDVLEILSRSARVTIAQRKEGGRR